MKHLLLILAAIVVLLAYGAAGEADRREQERADEHYVKMVQAGAWPDYKGIFNEK